MDTKFSGLDVEIEKQLATFTQVINSIEMSQSTDSDLVRKLVTGINDQISNIENWRNGDCQTKFEEMDKTIVKFREEISVSQV